MKPRLILATALLLALPGCGEGTKAPAPDAAAADATTADAGPTYPMEKELVFLDYLAPCTGVDVRSCMVELEPDGERQFFYSGVSGFDYAWGYRHELLVRVSYVPEPPADGSSLDYVLLAVLAKEKVPGQSRFELVLHAGYAESQEDGTFTLPDGRAITCASPALCDELGTRLAAGESFRVELSHPDDPADVSQPLVLQAIRDL